VNKLQKILEAEGVTQQELSNASGVAYGTVNKVAKQRIDVRPVTQAKMVKGLNKLSGKTYSPKEVFPPEPSLFQ